MNILKEMEYVISNETETYENDTSIIKAMMRYIEVNYFSISEIYVYYFSVPLYPIILLE